VVFGASNVSFVWESKTLTSLMENKPAQVAEMSDVSADGSRSDSGRLAASRGPPLVRRRVVVQRQC
jgi:hypothetical protein